MLAAEWREAACLLGLVLAFQDKFLESEALLDRAIGATPAYAISLP